MDVFPIEDMQMSSSLISPLLSAVSDGEIELLNKLITEGVDIHHKVEGGLTALLFASAYGHTEAIEKLLKHGANVDDRVDNGSTSLKFAIKRGHSGVTKILRQYSANKHLGFIEILRQLKR